MERLSALWRNLLRLGIQLLYHENEKDIYGGVQALKR